MTSRALKSELTTRATAPTMAGVWLPWEVLTRPSAAFAAQADASGTAPWLPALLAQFTLLLLGSIVAAPGNNDLIRAITGVAVSNPFSPLRVIELIAGDAFAILLLNCGFAALLLAGFRLLGFCRPYRQLLSFVALAFLPLMLGQALGQLLFAMAMPLSNNAAEILGWQLRPFTAGLATWLPQGPPPLSLQWALLGSFDLFGLWTLALGWIGIGRMLGAPRALLPWLQLILLLGYAAATIALWQAAQGWLAALKVG